MKEYIRGKGILVGTFTELDLKKNYDKEIVEQKKKETGLNYTNTEYVYENNYIIGIKIYVCAIEDVRT